MENRTNIIFIAVLAALIFSGIAGASFFSWQNQPSILPIAPPFAVKPLPPPAPTQNSISSPDLSNWHRTFYKPYPLVVTKSRGKFELTSVSIGQRTVLDFPIMDLRNMSSSYPKDTLINAVELSFKVTFDATMISDCSGMTVVDFRRITNDGDYLISNNGNNQYWLPGCRPNSTVYDQKVIFVVPEDENEFTFTTGNVEESVTRFFILKKEANGDVSLRFIEKPVF